MKKFFLAIALAAMATPVLAQDQAHRVTFVRGTAGVITAEASDFTAVADVAGSLAGLTFRFYNADDAKCYQPWYKVSGVGSAPTASTGCTLVEVDIATGDTNSTVAATTRTTLNAAPYTTYFAITGATTHIIVTNLTKGAATDGNIGTSGFAISKTQGVSSTRAIADVDLLGDTVLWKVCNDAVNTSTWLAVGEATDTEGDGTRLAKDGCYECAFCRTNQLKLIRVSAQAATNGYTVIQYAK